jgi:hypothetical protein
MVPDYLANYFLASAGAYRPALRRHCDQSGPYAWPQCSPATPWGSQRSLHRSGQRVLHLLRCSCADRQRGYATLLLGLSGLANSIWRNTRLLRGPWRMRRPDDMGFTQWLLIVIGTQVLPVVLYGSESALALLFLLRPSWRFPGGMLTYVL